MVCALRFALVASVPLVAQAHGAMTSPPSFHDRDGSHVGEGGRSIAGCTGKSAPGQIEKAQGCVGEWYSNYTFIPGEPSLLRGSPMLTYQDACMSGQGTPFCCSFPCTEPGMMDAGQPCEGCDWTRKNPWRAPGTAPIFSPCGVDGGNPQGCPVGSPDGAGCAAGGYGHGPDGRSLPGNTKPAVWTAGAEAEVAWGVVANHGGGYSYRLCPKPAEGYAGLTEECFQQTPLRFVGETQWLQEGRDGEKLAVAALRTDSGTFPAGSQWTRNPIPACLGFGGGAPAAGGVCDGTQFAPPADGVFGFLQLPWNIIDRVQVPQLPAGDYVISFRYDCEQTSQVWSQCGDVRIVASEASV